MISTLVRIFTPLVLTAPALAQVVEIVRPGGGLSYSRIQDAVDAAVEGDALLVTEGSYEGFTIDRKSVSIFAVPGSLVEVEAVVVVQNLDARQSVVLSGLVVETPASNVSDNAVRLVDCAGAVRLQDCWLGQELWWQGGIGWDCILGDAPTSAPAVVAFGCARVALVDCELRGNPGVFADDFWEFCDAGQGGAGLEVVDSDVALYDCFVRGGYGGSTSYYGTGTGGTALVGTDSIVFTSGTDLLGGPGGITWAGGGPGGPGGDGVWLSSATTLTVLDGAVSGAPSGGPPGTAVTGPGRLVTLDGRARHVASATVVPSASALDVTYRGVQHDLVWVPVSARLEHEFLEGLRGLWMTALPPAQPFVPHGLVDASGELAIALPLLALAPGAVHATFAAQGLALGPPFSSVLAAPAPVGPLTGRAPTGVVLDRRLASARHVLALADGAGPDCNGNGVSDYLDIIVGTSLDTNHDLRPDECGP